MQIPNASYWIDHLKLQPHPEGGYYTEIFRSQQAVIRATESTIKQACTSIYYLLEGSDFSGFHRIASDEIWYFHKGMPLLIHVIDQEGQYTAYELADNDTGNLSVVVPAGSWFAAAIPTSGGFTLVSCVVAPGFDFNEFEMAKKHELIAQYPQHTRLLNQLCRQ